MKNLISAKKDCSGLPNIQDIEDLRGVIIDKVGIRGITHPVCIKDRSRKEQHTVAVSNMYVTLPENLKGTHMSRFVEILNEYEYEITVKTFRKMISEMKKRLKAESGHIEMNFPYFIVKTAPVSGTKGIMDYNVSFLGEENKNEYSLNVKVVVPVTSLCPCSKAISDFGAHNQRSNVTLTVQMKEFVWIEELIEIVEKEASCELYGVLKRSDEKFVTEYAYQNPKFVEDIVRDISMRLNNDDRIIKYTVESENFESIHNHSAFALIERDKTDLSHN